MVNDEHLVDNFALKTVLKSHLVHDFGLWGVMMTDEHLVYNFALKTVLVHDFVLWGVMKNIWMPGYPTTGHNYFKGIYIKKISKTMTFF